MHSISLNNIIPHAWKLSNIIPISKPNKDRDQPGVVKDERNGGGGGIEREGSEVDGTEAGATGEEVGVCRRERGKIQLWM